MVPWLSAYNDTNHNGIQPNELYCDSQHYDNELLNAERQYDKYRHAVCHSNECCGAFLMSVQMHIYNGKIYHGVI